MGLRLNLKLRSFILTALASTLRHAMSDDQEPSLRDRITRSGEDAIGRLASDLLENPLVTAAIGRVFEAREKAVQAQAAAWGALNLPSAADLERLTRRLRSVSQRLEGLEDGVDKLDRRLGGLAAQAIGAIEEALAALSREIAALREALPDAARPVPTSQERLQVDETPPPARPRRRKPAAS
jgi:chromosome segregation ATPase